MIQKGGRPGRLLPLSHSSAVRLRKLQASSLDVNIMLNLAVTRKRSQVRALSFSSHFVLPLRDVCYFAFGRAVLATKTMKTQRSLVPSMAS